MGRQVGPEGRETGAELGDRAGAVLVRPEGAVHLGRDPVESAEDVRWVAVITLKAMKGTKSRMAPFAALRVTRSCPRPDPPRSGARRGTPPRAS